MMYSVHRWNCNNNIATCTLYLFFSCISTNVHLQTIIRSHCIYDHIQYVKCILKLKIDLSSARDSTKKNVRLCEHILIYMYYKIYCFATYAHNYCFCVSRNVLTIIFTVWTHSGSPTISRSSHGRVCRFLRTIVITQICNAFRFIGRFVMTRYYMRSWIIIGSMNPHIARGFHSIRHTRRVILLYETGKKKNLIAKTN